MTEWILLLAVIALIAANAVFVAAEFSFVTADRPAVNAAAERGEGGANGLRRALQTMSTQLSGAQLGITVTSLIAGAIAEPSVATLLRRIPALADLGEAAALSISVTLAFILVTIFQMVFGELVPKNWAIAEPLRVGKMVAPLQRGFTWVTRPLLIVLQGSANGILRLFGVQPQEELASARSAEELAGMARLSARDGVLEREVAKRVVRTTEFGNALAGDAMTPRPRVHFLHPEQTAAEILAATTATGHSRFLVIGDDVDHVLGGVHFRTALAVPTPEQSRVTVGDLARPVPAVPETMPLDAVLDHLRGGLQMAVVVDEYDGTAGLVTLEDLIEELVGEIQDEHDAPLARARQVDDERSYVSGHLRPDELDDICGLEVVAPENVETISGVITATLERFPREGDEIVLDAHDLRNTDDLGLPRPVRASLTVLRLDGRIADRLLLQVLPAEDDSDTEHDSDTGPDSENEEGTR